MNTKTPAELFKEVLNNNKTPKIKLLGDSITHGVGGTGWEQKGEEIVKGWSQSPDGYCWANLFRDYMKEKYGATVINKACTGTRIEFILKHFEILVDGDEDLIVCMIGTNNRHQYFSEGEKETKEARLGNFYKNIQKLYRQFLDKGIPVIFMANIPASKADEKDGGNFWRILHMNDINDAYKRFSNECGATVFSLYDAFSRYCEKNEIALDSLLKDGLHPNDEGYKVMFYLIIQAFDL